MNTNKRGRPALPEGEKKVMFSRRLKPAEIAVVTAALSGKSISTGVVKAADAYTTECVDKYKRFADEAVAAQMKAEAEVGYWKARFEKAAEAGLDEKAQYWKAMYNKVALSLAKYENDGSS